VTGPADDVEADFDDDDGVPFEGTVLLEVGTFSSFTEDFSSFSVFTFFGGAPFVAFASSPFNFLLDFEDLELDGVPLAGPEGAV